MGEQQLDFTPQCVQLEWLKNHLGGWQFGEQQLIPAILDAIGAHGACVEYGAGDGDSLPLTIEPLYEQGRMCFLAECDVDRIVSLRNKYRKAHVQKRIVWQDFRSEGRDLAAVVIDVDSIDSVIMRQMLESGCRPSLVVCEHFDRHYSIPTSQPSPIPEWMLGMKMATGHSIQDTAETLHWIAAKYGYERLGLNRCNSFFVRRDVFPLLFRH